MLRRAGLSPSEIRTPARQGKVTRERQPVIRCQARRAVVRRVAGQKRQAILAQKVSEQDYRCALCGCSFSYRRPPTVDHIVPIASPHNGDNNIANLQAAHGDCNNLRGSLTMAEFVEAVTSGRLRLPEPPDPDQD